MKVKTGLQRALGKRDNTVYQVTLVTVVVFTILYYIILLLLNYIIQPIFQQLAWLLIILKFLYFMEPWPLAMPWENTLTMSWFFNCDLEYLKTLSQTPFMGIVKSFFNGIGFGYDVTRYVSRGAENYDCLISKVKGTLLS